MKIKYDSHTQNVIKQRYLREGETCIEDVFRRTAKHVASVEKDSSIWEERFYHLMASQTFLPNSPLLWSSGLDICMPMACYVLSPEDSKESIFNTLRDQAIIQSRGGGTGANFSNLRPQGSKIGGSIGRASGPISYMKLFDLAMGGEVISQGKRGGAMMGILNYDHPSIEEFITCKQSDSSLKHFNVSVMVTDEFMTKVQGDEEITLWHPKGDGSSNQNKKIKARDLFNKLVKNAHAHAEPGLLFYDRINKDNLLDEPLVASNPCQPSWAKVLTPSGIREFRDINVGDKIWSKEGWTTVIKKWSNGIKPVYKFETTSSIFYGTEYHQLVSNGEKIIAKEADSIDSIYGHYRTDYIINPQDVMDGLMIGDGSKHQASGNLLLLHIGQNDTDYFSSEVSDLIIEHRPGINDTAYLIKTTITSDELPKTYDRRVPVRYICNPNKLVGFLRGLYSANGSVCDNRITLKSTSKGLVEDVQLMLSSIGIRSYYTTNKASKVKFNNGTYLCKQSYDINITSDRDKFKTLIGFIQEYKNDKIVTLKSINRANSNAYNIINIEFIDDEEVFDITVDNQSHTYWTQGCDVSNCSEQMLPNWSACNLGSINLAKFVENGQFNQIAFHQTVCDCVRFLDNVIDIANFPLAKNKEVVQQERRIGLGIMGLADALILMNIKYGSKESEEFVYQLIKQMYASACNMSEKLAVEKGCSDLLKSCCAKHNINLRRNLALLTIAPTGTISMLAQCSGGIEPIFSFEYTRNDTTGTSVIKHPLYEKYKDDPSIDKDVWVDAYSLSPEQHLNIQAAAQYWCDSSISKTINLPKDATEEDVYDLFMKAWKLGVKGITVYRDGSIPGQVLTKGIVSSDPSISCNPKSYDRPKVLPCEIHFHSVKGSKWCILLGIYNEEPYEVFAIPGHLITWKPGGVGVIEKVRKSTYRFFSEGYHLDITSEVTNHEQTEICRLASAALRHRIPLEFLVEQLDKSLGEFHCMSKSISRTLKKFIKDGTKVHGILCPECGSSEIVRIGGCPSCKCGWSKCA